MNQPHESYQNEDMTNVQPHTKVAAGQPSTIFTTNEEDTACVGMHNVTVQSNVHQSFLQCQDHESSLFGQTLPFSNNEADTTADVQILDQHDQNHNFAMCNNAEHVSNATKPPSLDDFPEITFTEIVALDTIFNESETPEIQQRTRNPDKFFTSPYVGLPEYESSVRDGPVYFCIKHPFQYQSGFKVDVNLINEFTDWVYKNTSSRKGRLDIYSSIEATYIDKSQTDLLRFELVPNTPQQDPASNDCDLYTCVVAEFITNGVFEISADDFDANYHRRRIDTLLWQYEKHKHNDGAISESEVTGSLARKLGGPRRLRDHAPGTFRYAAPTPKRQ